MQEDLLKEQNAKEKVFFERYFAWEMYREQILYNSIIRKLRNMGCTHM
jgi:hypothetical protein